MVVLGWGEAVVSVEFNCVVTNGSEETVDVWLQKHSFTCVDSSAEVCSLFLRNGLGNCWHYAEMFQYASTEDYPSYAGCIKNAAAREMIIAPCFSVPALMQLHYAGQLH